jgi:Flp pilus assembly protein TadD
MLKRDREPLARFLSPSPKKISPLCFRRKMNPAVQKQWLKYGVCVLLAVVTWAAFARVANDSFIPFDDLDYITLNTHIQHGFTWGAIKWAFTAVYASNWHPLTWLSHTLDWQLYHYDPAGYHLINLAFHVANTVLLFLLLQNTTSKLWPSAFVAMLFGIHPMHVESVAWVAERKDMLSTFFLLLTLLAYARYVELARDKKTVRWMVYGLALLLFALGLLAKPMLVTLPGILCLLDLWPLRRFQLPFKSQPKPVLHRLILEKIPFFMLALLCSYVTYAAQNGSGAVKQSVLYPLGQRLEHVPVAMGWYVFKVFWPVNLSVYHRLPFNMADEDTFWPSLFLLGVTALAVWRIRKSPYFFVGWFWFLGTLVPVIGIVQVGNQAYADRYTYIPYIGLFISLVWGVAELFAKWPAPRRAAVLGTAGLLLMAVCFWRTVVEVGYWKNGLTLFQRAIELNPNNEMAWLNLGHEYENNANNDKAITCYTKSVTINDRFDLGWLHLGKARVLKKDYPGAISAFQTALSTTWFSGDKAPIYTYMGDAYSDLGQYGQAIIDYQNSLGVVTNQPDVLAKLGQTYIKTGQSNQAGAAFQNAINLDNDNSDAHLGLAMLQQKEGRDAEAIGHYKKVVELDTNIVIALNNLAWLLAADPDPKLRDGKAAVPLAEHACDRTHYRQAFFIGTLAAAYAEAGRFNDAVAAAQKAHDVAMAQGEQGLADQNARLMQLYQSGHSYHMEAKTPP